MSPNMGRNSSLLVFPTSSTARFLPSLPAAAASARIRAMSFGLKNSVSLWTSTLLTARIRVGAVELSVDVEEESVGSTAGVIISLMAYPSDVKDHLPSGAGPSAGLARAEVAA